MAAEEEMERLEFTFESYLLNNPIDLLIRVAKDFGLSEDLWRDKSKMNIIRNFRKELESGTMDERKTKVDRGNRYFYDRFGMERIRSNCGCHR